MGRLMLAALALVAGPARAWEPSELFAPCRNDCGLAIYGGNYAETPMGEALDRFPPTVPRCLICRAPK